MKLRSSFLLLNSNALVARAARFAIVGIMSSGLYAAVTIVGHGVFRVDPKISSILGYLASIPFNFFFNRHFSFQSDGGASGEAIRFGLVHLANLVLTSAIMLLVVDVFNLHYFLGITFVIIFVPIVNFVIMNWWVFQKSPTPD